MKKIFILISLILYILFIFFSDHVPVIELEYIGILLCLGMSFFIKGKYQILMRVALIFTAISDYLLLFTDVSYQISVLIFSIVHLIYGYKLLTYNFNKVYLLIRIGLIVLTEVILLAIFGFDFLLVVAAFYFVNLLINVIFSFLYFPKNYLFAFGLLFFLCCDLFVGIRNSGNYLNLPPYNFGIDPIWLFYFPAQVLLTLSIGTEKISKIN